MITVRVTSTRFEMRSALLDPPLDFKIEDQVIAGAPPPARSRKGAGARSHAPCAMSTGAESGIRTVVSLASRGEIKPL
jgi:hypothetical protein